MPTPTWLLFESGAAVQINLTLFNAPQGAVRPMDAYVVTECEGSFTKSARRAAEAVAGQLEERLTTPQVVGFDLPGLSDGCGLTGESGGLAFSIGLAKALVPDIDPGPVAATGELLSANGRDSLGPVKGIEAKLMAAAKLLPAEGRLLYPRANHAEVSVELFAEIMDKGIKVQAVDSLAEALELLFGAGQLTKRAEQPSWTRGALWWKVVLVAGGIGAILWFSLERGEGPVPKTLPDPQLAAQHEQEKEIALPVVAEPEGEPQISVEFSGSGTLSKRLAEEVSRRVAALAVDAGGNLRVQGRAAILLITEDMDETAGELSSAMTVAVRELQVNGEGIELAPTVEVEGRGRAGTLVSLAAEALALKVAETIIKE